MSYCGLLEARGDPAAASRLELSRLPLHKRKTCVWEETICTVIQIFPSCPPSCICVELLFFSSSFGRLFFIRCHCTENPVTVNRSSIPTLQCNSVFKAASQSERLCNLMWPESGKLSRNVFLFNVFASCSVPVNTHIWLILRFYVQSLVLWQSYVDWSHYKAVRMNQQLGNEK